MGEGKTVTQKMGCKSHSPAQRPGRVAVAEGRPFEMEKKCKALLTGPQLLSPPNLVALGRKDRCAEELHSERRGEESKCL